MVTRNGKPAAKLTSTEPRNPLTMADVRGIWRGQVQIADDFDELPDDIAEAFGMQ